MTQLLLLPDPRPLVERLGADFFRQAPERPGVYLMRDCADTVLYVGKAKNLRKRLASYRVANPDRMPRRHLRLVRAVSRIELQECADEPSALARESELLRTLRPRFNRAGTWLGPRRFLAWQLNNAGLNLTVLLEPEEAWQCSGPMGSGAVHLRALLARLLWCAASPAQGPARLPQGWFRGHLGEIATIPHASASPALSETATLMARFFAGDPEPLTAWLRDRAAIQTGSFAIAALNADLELLEDFAKRNLALGP